MLKRARYTSLKQLIILQNCACIMYKYTMTKFYYRDNIVYHDKKGFVIETYRDIVFFIITQP